MRFGYARVSTTDQDLAAQRACVALRLTRWRWTALGGGVVAAIGMIEMVAADA